MWKLLLLCVMFVCSLSNDKEVIEETVESIKTSLNTDQLKNIKESGQSMPFQAEVSRLMEIIVNSLYKTRDIFARELISNANDAIDKIRYNSLTNPDVMKSNQKLEIKVQANKEKKTLTFLDSGIGMTATELAKFLGTVAHSGTASFLDKYATAKKDGVDPMSLIGQFGVGFYSAFLVSDEVTVISKSNDDEQHIWNSRANGSYTVTKDPNGNTMGRGTAVILQIKEDAQKFLEQSELEKIIRRYSEFIQYPIYLYSTKTEYEEVPVEDEKKDDEKDDKEDKDDDLDVKDDKDDGKKKPKTKTVEKKIQYWQRLNANKPIWSRRPSQIEKEEYIKFYKSLTKDTGEPIEHTHFRAEGEIEFNSILFIPSKAPMGMYEQYYNQKSKIKLYVRRVLVADEFENIVPKYLNFMRGLVDSNDLPLNVNREDLQKSAIMTIISRKLTRKALDMLKKMAESDADDDDKEKEPKDAEEEKKIKKKSKYMKFWKEFGKSVKLGYLEDSRNKKRLLELLRFPTSKSEETPIALATYVKNMKPGQKFIYTLSAASVKEAKNSPFMERLVKKGYEVIYMVENLDEYLHLKEYDDFEFKAITKDGTKVDGTKMEEFLKEKEKEFDDFKTWLKTLFKDKISRVQIANTLNESPMAVATAKYGYSARMEKIAGNQAFGGGSSSSISTKILQINYRHPIILKMKKKVDDGEGEGVNSELKDLANLMLDVALIQSGFDIAPSEHSKLAQRVHRIVKTGLGVDANAKLESEPEIADEIDDAKDDENEDDDEDDEKEDKAEAPQPKSTDETEKKEEKSEEKEQKSEL